MQCCLVGSPSPTRTGDLRINSPSLYQLSYQGFDAGAILTADSYPVNKWAHKNARAIKLNHLTTSEYNNRHG